MNYNRKNIMKLRLMQKMQKNNINKWEIKSNNYKIWKL